MAKISRAVSFCAPIRVANPSCALFCALVAVYMQGMPPGAHFSDEKQRHQSVTAEDGRFSINAGGHTPPRGHFRHEFGQTNSTPNLQQHLQGFVN